MLQATLALIEREIARCLVGLFEQYPFVTVPGPQQSGKTMLCRTIFPQLDYVNLEAPDQREFTESDPRGFLARLGEGATLGEIQRVLDLLSYLQVLADEAGRNSLIVLTESEQFRLSDAVSQSLAGRTALLRLLPFSLAERRRAGASDSIDDILYSGFYPRIHDRKLEPRQALGDYFETYVERNARGNGEIRNLANFRRFTPISGCGWSRRRNSTFAMSGRRATSSASTMRSGSAPTRFAGRCSRMPSWWKRSSTVSIVVVDPTCRFPGQQWPGMRPAERDRQRHGGHRDEVRRDGRLQLVRFAQPGSEGTARHHHQVRCLWRCRTTIPAGWSGGSSD